MRLRALVAPLLFLVALIAPPLRRVHADERGQLNPFDPDSWKGLFKKGAEAIDKLTGGVVGDGIDAVGTVIHTLADLVVTVVDTGANIITGGLQIGASIVSGVVDAGANIITAGLQIAASIVGGITDIGGNVISGILQVAGAIVGGVTDIGGNIISGILQVAGALGSAISDAIGNALSGALQVTGALGQFLSDLVANLITGLLEIAGSIVGGMVDVLHTIGDHLVDLGGVIAAPITRTAEAVENVAETAIDKGLDRKSDIIKMLLGLGIPGGMVALIAEELVASGRALDFLEWAGEKAGAAGGKVAREVMDHVTGFGQIDPEDAPELAIGVMLAQSVLGESLAATAEAKDFIPFLDNSITAYMLSFLGNFTGWEPTIHSVYEPIIANAIGRPMERLINKHTTTNLPGEGVLSELLGRRDIASDTYDSSLSEHGFKPFWKTVFEPSSFRPARLMEIVRIMQFTDIPDDQLEELLNTAAYNPATVPPLKEALKRVALSRSNTKFLTELNESYQKGFIDAGQYGGGLTVAGIKESEQGQWQFAASAAYNNQVKSELLSAWQSAAAKDAMTDDELRAALSVIGLTGAKIEVEVLRAQAKRLKKPTTTVDKAHEKAVNAARGTFATAYRLQFKKGLIDAGALSAALIAIGYEPIQADAFVTLAEAEKYTPPKAVQDDSPEAVSRRVVADLQAAYIAQFRNDAIDAGALKSSLVGIGVNDFEASSIVAREQARKTPSPSEAAKRTAERVAAEVQSTLKAAYAEQFQKGLITAAELETNLIGIGVDGDAARAFRLLQEARSFHPDPVTGVSREQALHDRQLQAAQKAAAVEEFRVKMIDAAELRADLIAAGIAADIADAIVAEETARASAGGGAGSTPADQHARELRNAQKAAAIQEFRHQLIDAQGLFDALVAAGIADDVADALTVAEIARATKPAAAAPAP